MSEEPPAKGGTPSRPLAGETSTPAPLEIIQPPGWPVPQGYANAVAARGRQLFLAGQVGWNPLTGTFAGDDMAAQAAQALANVATVLRAAGAEPRHVTRLTWYVTDRGEYLAARQAIGAAYRAVMGRHYPAMSMLVVHSLLEERAKVEIEATAIIPDPEDDDQERALLIGPNSDDLKKIHAEVNQLVNQRFVLTTLAITVFSVVTALLIPKGTPQAGAPVGGLTFLLCTILSMVLFSLFLLSHLLKGMLRVFTTYLDVTGSSDWEKDWAKFRRTSYLGYTRPQSLVFLILNFFATVYPLILSTVFSQVLEPAPGAWIAGILGVVVEVFIWGMAFQNWWDREEPAKTKWQGMKGGG